LPAHQVLGPQSLLTKELAPQPAPQEPAPQCLLLNACFSKLASQSLLLSVCSTELASQELELRAKMTQILSMCK